MSIIPKSLIARLGATVIGGIILAIITFYSTSLPTAQNRSKEKFLPSLGAEVDNLAHIHIMTDKEEVHLDNNNNFWQVREKKQYAC